MSRDFALPRWMLARRSLFWASLGLLALLALGATYWFLFRAAPETLESGTLNERVLAAQLELQDAEARARLRLLAALIETGRPSREVEDIYLDVARQLELVHARPRSGALLWPDLEPLLEELGRQLSSGNEGALATLEQLSQALETGELPPAEP